METSCIIARLWRGEASSLNADAYEKHVTQTVFPEVARLAGHRGAAVLRRETEAGVEFLVVTLWDSKEDIVAFAGNDIERAVVEPAAVAVLSAHDDFVRHYRIVHHANVAGARERAVPIFPVRDVRAAVAHYEKLGFRTDIHDDELEHPTYGFAFRGGIEIHFAHVERLDPNTSVSACYLHVDDADAIHAAWMSAGVLGRITDIEHKPWGKREFAHVDPDGNLVRVGS